MKNVGFVHVYVYCESSFFIEPFQLASFGFHCPEFRSVPGTDDEKETD